MPTCSMTVLRIRAAMLQAARRFFDSRGFLEVETPLLSRDIVVDAHLHAFEVCVDGLPCFLQTSPEAGMKRLLAAGSGSIYQITRSFRSRERGVRHNPEFTMLEWYAVGSTHHQQMQLTEDLVRFALQTAADVMPGQTKPPALATRPFDRIQYDSVFRQILGETILGQSASRIQELARQQNLELPEWAPRASADDLLNWILAEWIEPNLGTPHPAFLTEYPASQAALARRCPDDVSVAERFELYFHGIELCNGYHELTDPAELLHRDDLQNSIRKDQSEIELPGAPRLLQAMTRGLPPCSGVALGFDRLVMIATGATSIDQVMPFPIDRA